MRPLALAAIAVGACAATLVDRAVAPESLLDGKAADARAKAGTTEAAILRDARLVHIRNELVELGIRYLPEGGEVLLVRTFTMSGEQPVVTLRVAAIEEGEPLDAARTWIRYERRFGAGRFEAAKETTAVSLSGPPAESRLGWLARMRVIRYLDPAVPLVSEATTAGG